MGSEVSDEDVEKLTDEHNEEPATKELQNLHLEVTHSAHKEVASDEKVPSCKKDFFSMWS